MCASVCLVYNSHTVSRWVLKEVVVFIIIFNMGMACWVACDNKCYPKENTMIIIKLCNDNELSILYY